MTLCSWCVFDVFWYLASTRYVDTNPLSPTDIQNTQSGSQWDGMKHLGILEHGVYYNKYEDLPPFRVLWCDVERACGSVQASSIPVGLVDCTDPKAVDPLALKLGIQSQPFPILSRDPQRLMRDFRLG